MTKKHFTALAEALAASKPLHRGNPEDRHAMQQWHDDRHAIMDVCTRFNPNFDRDRFVAATEAP